ncbi:MAG: nicotinate (nicotinamide) nucleotide adenylyltransferase [Burkholderiaceae bacterium]|nr:nicotinate (nicotinamide) nucleotide adenylyltransferase [Burkholderiaceae bacterium]
MTLRRVAIFGGSFDPPHNAHVALARTAREALALDEVRWIPAGQPWQKARAMTPAEHREAMVRLAIGDAPGQVLSRIELERSGPSVTLDTVTAFRDQEPGTEWVLLIGGDQYANLHTWRGWQQLLDLTVLAVAQRPGTHAAPDPAVQRRPHRVVPLPMLDIASTDIRVRVARGDRVDDLVPPAVARYIDQHHLYRD